MVFTHSHLGGRNHPSSDPYVTTHLKWRLAIEPRALPGHRGRGRAAVRWGDGGSKIKVDCLHFKVRVVPAGLPRATMGPNDDCVFSYYCWLDCSDSRPRLMTHRLTSHSVLGVDDGRRLLRPNFHVISNDDVMCGWELLVFGWCRMLIDLAYDVAYTSASWSDFPGHQKLKIWSIFLGQRK